MIQFDDGHSFVEADARELADEKILSEEAIGVIASQQIYEIVEHFRVHLISNHITDFPVCVDLCHWVLVGLHFFSLVLVQISVDPLALEHWLLELLLQFGVVVDYELALFPWFVAEIPYAMAEVAVSRLKHAEASEVESADFTLARFDAGHTFGYLFVKLLILRLHDVSIMVNSKRINHLSG